MKICFANNVMLLVWFIMVRRWSWVEGCSEEQKRALLQIKNATNGLAFSEWDGRDCCSATGIFCDDDEHTTEITTISLYKDKKAPSSTWYPNVTLFTLFDHLQELYLDNMHIGGELTAFCELKKLKNFTLLNLGNNTLEGIIPPCLGDIQTLQQLDLSNNRLRGNVPSSLFSNQSKIMLFDVSGNQLLGPLSLSIFANASHLDYLDLSNNYRLEVETESTQWVPNFYLKQLNLANCNLNKNNGHVVPKFIYTQETLEWLDLSHNSIKGSIPCKLLFHTSIKLLFLRNNKFEGSLLDCYPNVTSTKTSLLKSLDISDNHVKGPLPENIGHLFPDLFHVNMSSNALQGSIPSSFGNLSFEILDLSWNMFSGTIPPSLTRNGSKLVYLNLSNNKLRGEMLPRDSNMEHLECLQLSSNLFEGNISPAISNSPSLVILDVRHNLLSGNIPSWLYDHPRLVAVLLKGNHFEGHILRRMCYMKSLQVMDISENRLSGGIPSCLGNITFWKKTSPSPTGSNYFTLEGRLYYLMHTSSPEMDIEIGTSFLIKHMVYTFNGIPLSLMTGIDMSLNRLTGTIPYEMGKLSVLRSLNLSNNLLTGPIPNSFGSLKNVESLDLSHNMLSGEIPQQLVQLTYLSAFSVAFNNLSGRVPFEQQFSTFSRHCYEGNPDLCGEPLPRKCSTTNEADPEDKDEKEGATTVIDSPLFFFAFVVFSYAFGFWGFFGVLFFNKKWEHNYSRVVGRYIELWLEKHKYR